VDEGTRKKLEELASAWHEPNTPNYKSLLYSLEKAYELGRTSQKERDTSELLRGFNWADQVYVTMFQFAGHAADCNYGIDNPEGDFCVCQVRKVLRELKQKLNTARERAIRGAEDSHEES
jgi:hypothetical protein